MATVTKGKTFGTTEEVTAAKLHQLVDSATVTAIVNADIDASADISGSKLADASVVAAKLATDALELAYPVGSVYINATNSTNPNTLLGFGTWVAFGAGRVPVGIDSGDTDFDTAEETGGTKTPTMPSHSHSFDVDKYRADNGTGWEGYMGLKSHTAAGSQDYGDETITTTTASSGDSSNGNLPPYIVVHMWKRTA